MLGSDKLIDKGFQIILTGRLRMNKKKYCHRLPVSGEELYYVAIVGQKKKSVDVEYFQNRFRNILLPIEKIQRVG